MSAPREIKGLTVAISGAARGIGRCTAETLVGAGARVAIGDLDQALAEQTAGEIANGTIGLALDVTKRESYEAFIAAVEEQLGPIDVLINNAGIMHVGRFLEESDEIADLQLDVNCRGVLHGMKTVLPRFVGRGRGHLINIASITGKVGTISVATYSGTKHFVVGVSETVHEELKGTGVNISYVCPGPVRTEMTTGIPDGRFVKFLVPQDVADAVLATVRKPRVDVFVPRSLRSAAASQHLVPRPGRELMSKAAKADVGLQTDQRARKAYEERAAASRSK
jgi:short-subunit dehydrogenase